MGLFNRLATEAPNSCGANCAQPLSCGHSCNLKCHPGKCMTCEVCPPSQRGPLSPRRVRLPQSSMIRDVERGRRNPGGLIQNVERDHRDPRGPILDFEQGRREPRLPRASSSIGWPLSSYGHDNRESRPSTVSGVVSRIRRPSRVSYDVSRPLHGLFVHIFGHSLLPLIILILGIAFMSCIIVQPYNYRQVAENSKIVSGVWFVVGFIGAVCSYKNFKCLKYIHEIVWIFERRLVRSSPTLMWYSSMPIGYNLCRKFTTLVSRLLWVLGPFIRYVTDDTVDNQDPLDCKLCSV